MVKMKNKYGFIRIIEAFFMIMLITGVLLFFFSQEKMPRNDRASDIREMEQEILKQIQNNASLRDEILSQNLPTEWDSFPVLTKSKIQAETPSDLNCQAKICNLNDECVLTNSVEENIFAQRILISADLNDYKLRQLKLFCWGK